MRVYYSHAMWTYGKPIESVERKQIRNRFPKCRIVDPVVMQTTQRRARKDSTIVSN